jgi:hypothetical protein
VFPDALFVVALWPYSQTEGLRHIVARLGSWGCKVTTFIPFLWRHAQQLLPRAFWDLPDRISAYREPIRAAYDTLDAAGKLEFTQQLNLRLHADLSDDPHPSQQYFPDDLFELSPTECFVDCGAFDGDTLAQFMQQSAGSFGRYIALEPDPSNFAAVRLLGRHDDRIATYRLAAGDCYKQARFS